MTEHAACPTYPYRKYFLNELPDEQRFKGFGKMAAMVAFTDADIIEGSQYFPVMVMGPEAIKHLGHGPHIHQDPELLVALETDMNNPRDLGAKIEMCMGPEKMVKPEEQDKMLFLNTDGQ
jgi:hypothetical protein